MSKFWAGVQPEVNTNFSSAGKTLENLTAELLTQTVFRRSLHLSHPTHREEDFG